MLETLLITSRLDKHLSALLETFNNTLIVTSLVSAHLPLLLSKMFEIFMSC